MPISSGFSFYKDIIPIHERQRIVRPQIYSRTSKSKATAGNKLPTQRPTAVVKQPIRSETFTLPTKHHETNFKVPKLNPPQNGFRQQPIKKSTIINSTPQIEQKPIEKMRRNGDVRPIMRQNNLFMNQGNIQRKPVRFANDYNNTYYSSSSNSAPVHYQKPAPLANPLPRDALNKSRRMRIANDEYVIHRRKDSPAAYAYNDYQTVSDIPTISYVTSLPPIDQRKNETAPTVIIHSKETHHSETPTIIPTISIPPSYVPPPPPPPPAPIMILPSSAAPSYPPNSTMFLPSTTVPSYSSISPMMLPLTTVSTQPSGQNFFLPPSTNPTYMSQPLFYPIPQSNPNPPVSAPPLQQQTIISQSSSSSTSAPATQLKTEENNTTFIVRPNTSNKKNVTIQVKMIDEDNQRDRTRSERVVHNLPYREIDDRYYIESEPKHIIYEQPTRRRTIRRRPPPPATEYIYVDESPSTVVRRRPHRSEVVYVNNEQPLEYEEEVVYVDDNGNEIEYIYDDEPAYHRRHYRTSHQPTSTRIVYE
ncbi:unnamed protein product [Rotaria sp. Silwood1]|nr:unnamed protein product [Rotaria sp. Silwood1]